jgi:cyclase
MDRRSLQDYARVFIAIVALHSAIACPGRSQAWAQPQSPGDGALTAELVKTGLYLISGAGGNSLLRLSANGLIVVDGERPGDNERLLAQVKKISDQPIQVLMSTDRRKDHTPINLKVMAAGAHGDDYTLRMGGIEVQSMHFGNAHTSADTVVYFPNLKVVAVGDLFAPTADPDFSAGGSLVDWGRVLAQVLKLDFDVVAPGMGPTVSRADLEAFKAKIDTLVSRATELVEKGVRKDQLMALLKTDDLGWQPGFTGERLDRFYAELSRTK